MASMAVAPGDPKRLYAGAQGQGLYESHSGGAAWLPTGRGLPALAVRALAVDPRDASAVYAGLEGGGLWKAVQGDRALYLPLVMRDGR